MIPRVNASAASQVRASQPPLPRRARRPAPAPLRFRATCAPSGPPGRRRTDRSVRRPRNDRNHALAIHDPVDLGTRRVDPPDAPANHRPRRRPTAAASSARRTAAPASSSSTPSPGTATCPICGFRPQHRTDLTSGPPLRSRSVTRRRPASDRRRKMRPGHGRRVRPAEGGRRNVERRSSTVRASGA